MAAIDTLDMAAIDTLARHGGHVGGTWTKQSHQLLLFVILFSSNMAA